MLAEYSRLIWAMIGRRRGRARGNEGISRVIVRQKCVMHVLSSGRRRKRISLHGLDSVCLEGGRRLAVSFPSRERVRRAMGGAFAARRAVIRVEGERLEFSNSVRLSGFDVGLSVDALCASDVLDDRSLDPDFGQALREIRKGGSPTPRQVTTMVSQHISVRLQGEMPMAMAHH